MKKLIILTLALTLVISAAAFATQTRVLTMGDNHVILTDDANIWNWPSRLNNYPSLAIGEFGYSGATFRQFGVHWQFGDDKPWVLATYFDNGFNYSPYWGIPFSTVSSNRRIHAFFAKDMGMNKFGARLSLYQAGQEFKDNDTTINAPYKQTFHYYEASLGLTANDDSWDIGVTGGFGSWTDEFNGQKVTEPDGLVDLAVLGRMFWESGPNYRYVPHAGVEFHRGGRNYNVNDTLNYNDKFTNFSLDLGIGQIYTPSTNVEAVLDLGIRVERNKEELTDADSSFSDPFENKQNYTSVPYFKLGLDAQVFDWMDVRLGATSFWQWYKNEYTQLTYTSEYKTNYSDNQTYLGFGFHWGNLHVDTYTDPQLFLEGFNFVSGGTQNMNFQFSAAYDLK